MKKQRRQETQRERIAKDVLAFIGIAIALYMSIWFIIACLTVSTPSH